MRIGYFVPEFPIQTHIMFWREIQSLRRQGETVILLSTRRANPGDCRHEFAGPATAETHYVFPPRVFAATSRLLARPASAMRCLSYIAGLHESTIAERLKKLGLLLCAADLADFACREELDHIHVHSCAESAHVAAMCRLLGGPTYSLTLHGSLSVYGKDHASKMARASFVSTAGSHLIEPIVDETSYPRSRIMPNRMGIETRTFQPDDLPRARSLSLRLITVARLNACKGHQYALGALRRVLDQGLDVCYAIVGDGPHRTEIEQCVNDLGLQTRVRLLGSRSEQEILSLLKEHDALVLPSVGPGEAAPVAVMEAMSCGVPTISSIIGSTPEMISDGVEGFLVDQTDEDGLARDRAAYIRPRPSRANGRCRPG